MAPELLDALPHYIPHFSQTPFDDIDVCTTNFLENKRVSCSLRNFKTHHLDLLINRFRVQVPAGVPSSRRREVWLRDLLEDRTPTQVLVLVDLAGRETLVENPHRIEPLTPGAVLTTFPVTAVATVTVMAALPVIVSFVLLAAVAMPLAAANSGDRAKERDKR
jgi:hypothetical protein